MKRLALAAAALLSFGCTFDDVIGGPAPCAQCAIERCDEALPPSILLRVGERLVLDELATLPAGTLTSDRPSYVAIEGNAVVGLAEGSSIVTHTSTQGDVWLARYVQVTACPSASCVEVPRAAVSSFDRQPIAVRDLDDASGALEIDGGQPVGERFVEAPADGIVELRAGDTASATFASAYWAPIFASPTEPVVRASPHGLIVGAHDRIFVYDSNGLRTLVRDTVTVQAVYDVAVIGDAVYAVLASDREAGAFRIDPRTGALEPLEGFTRRDARSSTQLLVASGELFALTTRYLSEGVEIPSALLRLVGTRFELVSTDPGPIVPPVAAAVRDGALRMYRGALEEIDLATGARRTIALPPSDTEPVGATVDAAGRWLIAFRSSIFREDDAGWTPLDRTALPPSSNPASGRVHSLLRIGDDVYMRNLYWRSFRLEGDVFVAAPLFAPLPDDAIPVSAVFDPDGRFVAITRAADEWTLWRSPAGLLGRAPRRPRAIALTGPTTIWVDEPTPLTWTIDGAGPLLFAVDNSSIARWTDDGALIGLRPGIVVARAIAEHDPSVTAERTIRVLEPSSVVRAIEVEPATVRLFVGESVRLSARAVARTDCGDHPPLDSAFAYTSTDGSIADVDARGLVHAIGPGGATLRVALARAPQVFTNVTVRVYRDDDIE